MHPIASKQGREGQSIGELISRAQSADIADEVFQFLSSPRAFDGEADEVEVITTHGAWVFLGRYTAYKVKQPVRYDYMDFSTLDQRRAICHREYEINRAFAPSIYQGVVAVTRSADGVLDVNGEGEVVEWAVQMKRFPEADVLERIAERGELTRELSALLGKQIAQYHLGLEALKQEDGALRIAEIIDELNEAFADPELALPKTLVQEFAQKALAALEAQSGHLDRRASLGFVRRCHGDLHLRNIVMSEGVPTPFDALEFDERLATTDVIYDFTFLIMDMLHRGLTRQANIVFNRYAHTAWPFMQNHGLEIKPLFLSMRAAIRAMVCAQTALRDPSSACNQCRDAEDYLLEALNFLQPCEPRLLAVGGLSGTGKSTLSAAIAPLTGSAPGALLLRSDLERKLMEGVGEYDHLPKSAYTESSKKEVYERVFEKARTALMQGQSVVLDAVFINTDEIVRPAALARDLKVPFCGLWLDAPRDVLIERVRNRRNDASDADVTIVKRQLEKEAKLNRELPEGWLKVDASGSPEQTLRSAELRLEHTFPPE